MFFLIKSILTIALMILLAAVTALSVVLSGAKGQYFLDLLCNFRPYLLLLQAVCLLLFFLTKNRLLAGVTVLCMIVNVVAIAPYYWPSFHSMENKGRHFKVMQTNLLATNAKHDDLLQFIQQEKPDIIAAEEVTFSWALVLEKRLSAYPFRLVVPEKTAFGIALFSKVPLKNAHIIYLGNGYGPMKRFFPSIIAEITLQQKPVTLVVTHPLPPLAGFSVRNSQLLDLAKRRRLFKKNLLVIGDLNTTPWSPHFQDFLLSSGLSDSQLGFGIQGSWLSPIPGIHLPIDHILVSPNFEVRNRKLGPNVGSDHLPVIAELTLH